MATTKPVRMTVLWLWKAIYGVGLLLFGLLTVASLASQQWQSALMGAVFTGLTLYVLILSNAYAEADEARVLVYTPLRGKFALRWDEIQKVETNGAAYVFRGAGDKAVSLNTLLGNRRARALRDFIDAQLGAHGIPVEAVTSPLIVAAKNTRVE